MKKLIAILLVMLMCLSVFVACNPVTPEQTTGSETTTTETETESKTETETKGDEYDVEAAAEYLDSLYKKENTVTAADYEVVGQVMIAGVKYMVTWSVDNELVEAVQGEPYWTINVDEKAAAAHSYTLTGTVTAPDGTTATVSYEYDVPAYNVTSFEDYMAAEKGATVTIQGIVVAMNAKSVGNTRNHLFLADVDGKGGYYCYQLDNDPVEAGVQIGMTVSVTAVVEPYSGMQETKGGTFTIVDQTIKTVEPLDITDKFTAGEDLKNYVGLPVVIKGVTLGTQDLEGSHQYLYFAIGEEQGYVRSYITDFPTTLTITKDEAGTVTSADKTAMDEDHAAHFGYKADATGILILYSGNPYLIPMSATPFTNYVEVVVTPEERVDAELGELKLDASVSSDKVIELPAVGKYYDNVTLTWAVTDETGAATIADGKLTLVVPDKAVTVTVTVTATCGEVTETKTFTIKLSKSVTSIKDAIEIGAAKEHNTYTEEKYIIAGIIKEVYNAQYGNMYIVDELGNTFTVYGTYSADGTLRYDAMEKKPVAGDYVVIVGILGQYNGTPQMKNGWIQSFTTPITIPEANELGNTFGKGEYTEDKKVITGVITEVQNTQYGNIVIADAEGNSILVYGLYSSNGEVRYDAMETKPVVGDTITVVGIIGKYNAPQMKNGWLVAHTASGEAGSDTETDTEADTGTETEPSYPGADSELSVEDAIALGGSLEHNTYTPGKYYVTGTITEVYNTQYGNMKITDGEGNVLTVYGTYNADGTVRYDGLDVKPVAGDVVTVYGIVGQYNGTPQVKNGWIVDHVPGEADTDTDTDTDTEAEKATESDVENTTESEAEKATESDVENTTESDVENTTESEAEKATESDTEPVTDPNALSIEAAIALGQTFEHNTYSTEKYYVTGVVKSITNTMYGNLYIRDAEGNELLVYGLYSADGSTRFDAMTTQPAVGDTITVYTVIGNYNGGSQGKNAWLTNLVPHTTHEWVDASCKAPKTCSVCGKTEGERTEHTYVSGACSVCGKPEGATALVNATIEFVAANRVSFDTSSQLWKQNDVTVTNNKGASTSDVADYVAPARFYKNSTLIVEGAGMSTIVFDCNTPAYATSLVTSLGTVSGATVSVDGDKVTVTYTSPVESLEVVLSDAQIRVDSITVNP